MITEFREDTYAQRLFLFEEAIVQRFGFVPCLIESTENDHQYVHMTGNAFILIPSTTNTKLRPRTATNVVRRNTGQKGYPVHSDQPSPHEAYITRHVSGKNKDDYSTDKRVSICGLVWEATVRRIICGDLGGIPLVVESHAQPKVEIVIHLSRR